MSQDLLQQGYQLFQAGRLAEAEQIFGRILAAEPANPGASGLLGFIRAQQGRNEEALKLMSVALEQDLHPAPALVNYGLVQQALGRLDEALASFDKALVLEPQLAAALTNRGALLQRLERFEAALADLDRAIALKPDDAATLNNRGNVLRDLNRLDEALDSMDRAVRSAPKMAVAWNNRGNVLRQMKRNEEALTSYVRALALDPNHVDAHYNRGIALTGLHRLEEALASYDQALAVNPGHVPALYNRGGVLRDLYRHNEAMICFEQILTLEPGHADAWHGRGYTLIHQESVTVLSEAHKAEAMASLEKALAIDPRHVNALSDRGFLLRDLGRLEEALASFEAAVAIDPGHLLAFGGLAITAMYLGNWEVMARVNAQMADRIAQGCVVQPLVLLGCADDAALQRQAAENFIKVRIRTAPALLSSGAPYRHDRIRLAYMGEDFGQHIVAKVLVELIERHDRTRFEAIGVSFRPDDGGALRRRFNRAFDRILEVGGKNHREVAGLLREHEVDIVVDLNGYTGGAYPEVLSYRAVPAQVSYIGFPGTMGAGFMDYIIGDATVTPMDAEKFFSEKIVQLPGCYLPSDTSRALAATPARKEAGLPEAGFVFAAFNAKWKITSAVFDVWMRLLAAVPDSVLWLPEQGTVSNDRLRDEALRRGVEPGRLVFYPPLPQAEHLARNRLADLFLDTTPYNAHSTAADALWAGLPILTCMGESMASRVCASHLLAAGLPELVTRSLEEYEKLALKLARDPALLKSFRDRLADRDSTKILFDIDRYRQGLEAAYIRMWETAERGTPAQAFAVT